MTASGKLNDKNECEILLFSNWCCKNDGTGSQTSKLSQLLTVFSGWQLGSIELESKKYPSWHLCHFGIWKVGQPGQPTTPNDLHVWKFSQSLKIGFRQFCVIFSDGTPLIYLDYRYYSWTMTHGNYYLLTEYLTLIDFDVI